MTPKEIAQKLGYTKSWVSLGVVDEAYLLKQWKVFSESDDKNEEHYRCGAFRDFLTKKDAFTDEEIDQFLELSDDGPDGCDLSANRAIELIEHGNLTDDQFSRLATHPAYQANPAKKRYVRRSVFHRVQKFGIKSEIEEIKRSDDTPLHQLLLESDDSPEDAIYWLTQSGRNKAIRNQAKIKLKKIRKAQPGGPYNSGQRSALTYAYGLHVHQNIDAPRSRHFRRELR
ncbi:hypothetical protein [Pelagicoccus sp. SDUM812003]|uniref:hypothetical protein n=1 Tax=Pelagicoccus sp. SDUM812003 TaxID=3041267 RepID=UPI00280FE28D|nr:hypothetical protein [Pelagicoccus sp. SDUM812003]MDQ8205805.1 hypothetical protein [Pelagicoccus sp. SDUM812003]